MSNPNQSPLDDAKKTIFVIILSDLPLCISLFFFPHHFQDFTGWKVLDLFTVRLVAAGLFSLDVLLYSNRNASLEVYKPLFNAKLLTFLFVILGSLLTIIQNEYFPTIAEWVLVVGATIPFIQLVLLKLKLDKI
jgi:hypothetical protein